MTGLLVAFGFGAGLLCGGLLAGSRTAHSYWGRCLHNRAVAAQAEARRLRRMFEAQAENLRWVVQDREMLRRKLEELRGEYGVLAVTVDALSSTQDTALVLERDVHVAEPMAAQEFVEEVTA